jgi:hypothetical protein
MIQKQCTNYALNFIGDYKMPGAKKAGPVRRMRGGGMTTKKMRGGGMAAKKVMGMKGGGKAGAKKKGPVKRKTKKTKKKK